MLTNQDVRDAVFSEILSSGGKVTQSSGSYRILYQLAKIKGVDMNGSSGRIAAMCHVKKTFVESLAKKVLAEYVSTGHFDVPKEFQMRGRY